MLKHNLMITTAIAALVLAAGQMPAQAAGMSDSMNSGVANVQTMPPAAGPEFRAALAREYRDLALYESDVMLDFLHADYFANKALAVSNGSDEIPAVPQLWDDINDRDMAELVAGRAKLTSAFDRHGRTLAPAEAAVAQARYDCWVEQTSEGLTKDGNSMSWQAADIAACKDQFHGALGRLDAAILAAQPAPAKVAEVPDRPLTYVPTNDGAVVYFEFDKSTLSQQAQRDIEGFIARTSGDRDLVVAVKGHTDRVGTAAYNDVLSRERAVAVKNELIRGGLVVRELEDLQVTAEGESSPAVATGDGVRNAMNRRAVISAYTPDRSTSGDRKRVSQNTR